MRARDSFARSLRWDPQKADFLVPVTVNGRICAARPEDGIRIIQRVLARAGFLCSRLTYQGFRAFLNTAGRKSALVISK